MKKQNSILLLVLLLISLLSLSVGNALAQDPPTITELVKQSVEDTGEFSTLLAALEASGLDEALDQPGTFTVFAPTDAAFDALPEGLLEELLEDPEGMLTDILLYHVLGEIVMAEELVGLDSVTTLLGQDISVAVDGEGNVILNGSVKVVVTDIEASNGVVHVIDAVLVPEETPSLAMTITELVQQSVEATGEFSTLLAALEASGLDEALNQPGTFTVFAPTDAAFDALPEGLLEELLEDPEGMLTDILLYHVLGEIVMAEELGGLDSVTTLLGQDISVAVDGEGNVILNGSVKVVVTDIVASNGVVHVIDAVLVPEETPSAVDMASFEVSASGGRVTVAWRTATELDNAGFNIYRSSASDGPFVKVNANLIAAQGDEMFGGSYSFVDRPGRGTFHYRLEYVDLSGASDWQELGRVETGPAIRRPLFRPNIPE